ncbi:hypothetical protein DYBT9623_05230 [Dyadobacter sp. CECT 9623]|uniref:Uncharacterized protein n=1 Tax=Dyadobacter linearis TaxID=2823330 RepID=A0ABN7RKE3_9BACT|nr:hypothetical protein [Dyadobacter sp. CECT 9623]CAG5074543.1 hypothetical protein DYBT9623_05230 [Dyadobacter sp. CECT 9623]
MIIAQLAEKELSKMMCSNVAGVVVPVFKELSFSKFSIQQMRF